MKKQQLWISLAIVLIAFFLVVAYYAWIYYGYINLPNIKTEQENVELFVYPDVDLEELLNEMIDSGWMKDRESFLWVAQKMSFDTENLKEGRYLIKNEMNNRQLIQLLRSGNQSAINLVVPEAPDLNTIASRLGQQLMQDSASISEYFNGTEFIDKFSMDAVTLKALIIPNTYQVWWTISPEDFVRRMQREYESFWDKNERRNKAAALGLSLKEVIILASIVERESNYGPERPSIAGVYLNRIKNNWPLQADPTVVFAMGNPKVRRVLNRDLEIDSPYNTYKYPGLPPGPICIPSINSIDAVLNADDHNYFFFCAAPNHSGTHVFSRTLSQHMQNARKFQSWLNQQRIMR